MSESVTVDRLSVDADLHRFVEDELLPGIEMTSSAFWGGLETLLAEFSERNADLLSQRDALQEQIDSYHQSSAGQVDPVAYQAFLREIGYVVPEPEAFEIDTTGVDAEISETAGPQLIVPILNARYAANAVNARWGSLYDALYGTDVVPDEGSLAKTDRYNAARGAEVIAFGRRFLDENFPLVAGSHSDVRAYTIHNGEVVADTADGPVGLSDPTSFRGYTGDPAAPACILLRHHGLGVEIAIDRGTEVGSTDPAGVSDIVLEAAVTTILDLEDSVAAVDGRDKTVGYRNWTRAMQGELAEAVEKGPVRFVRRMNPDRGYRAGDGSEFSVPGRALLLVRNVGHLMTTPAIKLDGRDVFEGILDAWVTVVAAQYDLRGLSRLRNSAQGSVYIVKPKMHGPGEVQLTCDLFDSIEKLLELPANTIKLGIMDEERRTTANLKACIHRARHRIAFINTGFLDRTGDEIHTSTAAGPMMRKGDMRTTAWIAEYERANVAVGLACGFRGRAQIGKGMWAAPDDMAAMLETKVGHPRSGASCAWVPSPTAATLHALHYHSVDVHGVQDGLARSAGTDLDLLLAIPLGDPATWSREDIQNELDNNVQGVLGYVVRWIDAGVGCSKVPDLGGTPLMEDRATCRISSQLVANWLQHGIITQADVDESLQRMAGLVDQQNASDATYRAMAPTFDGNAFLAARSLLFEGGSQPNGYTEPILHDRRLSQKSMEATQEA